MFRITFKWKNAKREPEEGAQEERCVSLSACVCVPDIIASGRQGHHQPCTTEPLQMRMPHCFPL